MPCSLLVLVVLEGQETERRARDRWSIVAALETTGGKIFGKCGAAELLGVRPTTLASRIRVLKIDTRGYVDPRVQANILAVTNERTA
jgi:transcriptional regulator with GAF, ATPase, and Fis domain